MSIERAIFYTAAFFTSLSGMMSILVDIRWSYFTIFIGVMLLVTAITRFCPWAAIYKKLGLKSEKFFIPE